MLFRKKKPINYLSLVPVRNVQEFEEKDGKVTLLLPKFKNEKIRKWLVPKHKSPHFKIHLDEVGTLIWQLVDGHKSVGEICSLLQAELEAKGQSAEQLDERTTGFFTSLRKGGFITFNEALSQSGV